MRLVVVSQLMGISVDMEHCCDVACHFERMCTVLRIHIVLSRLLLELRTIFVSGLDITWKLNSSPGSMDQRVSF